MNRRKVLLAMIMAPFARLTEKVEPKPIKTEADLTEAIDRGVTDWLGGGGVVSYEATYPATMPLGTGATITIVGYNNPDNDIVSLRFNGDGR